MKGIYVSLTALGLAATGCFSEEAQGLAPADPANTTVRMDFFARPLPEIPLPNDIATRPDSSSATGIRLNASMVAPTSWERTVRELIDRLDGWGTLQPISIPFTGPLDIDSILAGHRDLDYEMSNDVVYLINVDRNSPRFGTPYALDVGNGSYPVIAEDRDIYGKNDPRQELLSLTFEEVDEDVNGNGVLDPGEDTDADGLLDAPNYLPGHDPAWDDLAARADALMTFYDRQTHTLMVRPMEPLDERTTYAVVVTKRLRDEAGDPVGSPFEWINHTAQTRALEGLPEVLPEGLSLSEVAFAFTFTTQTTTSDMVAVREGLYGFGPQAHLGETFPAEIESLEIMRTTDEVEGLVRPYIVPGETFRAALDLVGGALLGVEDGSEQANLILQGTSFIDYFSVGSFLSPQLFERYGEDGEFLALNEQSWPVDLDRTPAPARAEQVYFSVQVPRKEVSVRGEGKPAPLLIYAHGHTSNRFESFLFGTLALRMGFAVIAIDAPSHGMGLADSEMTLITNLFKAVGMSPGGQALLKDRAFDHNFDGRKDSGIDFLTSSMFHTRDMFRQYALDQMQLIRIIRTFDGRRKWNYDVNGDGELDLAGDFDGDGFIDIGGDAPMYMMGGSLGGITTMIVSALEPTISAATPLVGGGGLSDVGFRSHNGSLPASLLVSGVTGPLYAGTIDPDSGELVVDAIAADLHKLRNYQLGRVSGVEPGDLMVVENLVNGVKGCGYVSDSGAVRAAVESDQGDATRILFYRGAEVLPSSEGCEFTGPASPVAELESFQTEFSFYDKQFVPGQPLEAIGFGLGRARGSANIRKMQMLGQLILDRADPASHARHLLREPLTYPSTGETTGAHTLSIPTLGDMNVPVSTAITHARAAGLIDYKNVDRRYDKPINQVLIDTHTTEGVHNLKRYVSPQGTGVHMDVENFSASKDIWEGVVPRLEEPLHLWTGRTDSLGGTSAIIFPLTDPEGRHGFFLPMELTDKARNSCRNSCELDEGEDPCGCEDIVVFDPALFILNTVSRYLQSGGMEVTIEECMGYNDCPWLPPFLPGRVQEELL